MESLQGCVRQLQKEQFRVERYKSIGVRMARYMFKKYTIYIQNKHILYGTLLKVTHNVNSLTTDSVDTGEHRKKKLN